MLKYSIKRVLLSIPLLLGMTLVTFIFIHLAPGNFLATLKLNPQISREAISLYETQYHLKEPIIVQYVMWLKSLVTFDLGFSFSYQAPVKAVIASRACNTLLLSVATLIFSWLVVIPLGIIAASRKNKFIDRALAAFSYIGISTPSFFLALLLLFAAFTTRWLPAGGRSSIAYDDLTQMAKIVDTLKHLILPVLVLSLGSIASLQRILRSNLLEIMGSQYIMAAHARGLNKARILYVHALRNALNPMITIFGFELSALLSGAALTEIILGWPGLGQVILEAVRKQDLYLVMGSVLMGGLFLIVGNLISDILLALSDPRIRFERRT
jgi:peptide/nickel transport system permease protein